MRTNRGSPCLAKYSSFASSRPSNQGRSALEQWSVQDHGDAVKLGERAHVQSTRDAAHHRRLLVRLVLEALAGHVRAATVGELDDHGEFAFFAASGTR